jgi:hypothetical protein
MKEMEVHYHPHLGKKKFKEYFFEFIMIFLAVTLGFFAEQIRERMSDRARAREYMRSMIEDLKADTTTFKSEIKTRMEAEKVYDTLIYLLNLPERTESAQQRLYYLARLSVYLIDFIQINDRTYDQMKSSGNLRLVRDQNIESSITKYYFNAKEIEVNKSQTLIRLQSIIELEGKIFNGTVFQQMTNLDPLSFTLPAGKPALMTEDKTLINELIMRLHYAISISAFTKNYIKELQNRASGLITVIEKKYKLRGE